MNTIGFLGCGNMGSAIIKQLAKDPSYTLLCYDAIKEVAQKVAHENNIKSESYDEVLKHSTIIILAVKPQVLPSLYESLRKYPHIKFISIAAGVTLSTLSTQLQTHNVVRFMPNMASSIGKSVTAITYDEVCDNMFADEAIKIGKSFGKTHILDESLFASFIGISGSGIAMMFSLFHNMAQGAVHSGLNYSSALSIIADTAMSAGALINESNEHPSALITKVCSPGGTTIEMMRALSDASFESAVMDGVIEAAAKAQALDNNKQ